MGGNGEFAVQKSGVAQGGIRDVFGTSAISPRSALRLLSWARCYLAKSCIASSAITPPVIAIGAKGAFAARSALVIMI